MPKRSLTALLLCLTAAAGAFAMLNPNDDPHHAAKAAPKGPLDFTVKDIDGKEVALTKYKGNVILIINTASKCGFTPQYASLEGLYQKYKDKGLRILAFPSNDFGGQEPGSEKEIHEFCTTRYKTTFDLFSKVKTQGQGQAPLYAYLTSKTTDPKFGGAIEWNFTKFLVGRDGQLIARFKSAVDPLSPEFTGAVEEALKASSK